MADPISILGLSLQAAAIVKLVMGYCVEVSGASKDMRNLAAELIALEGTLRHVQTQRHEGLGANGQDPSAFQELLVQTDQVLTELEKAFAQASESESKFKKAVRVIKWPLKKEEIKDQVQKLERLKTLFILVITGDSLSINNSLLQKVSRLGEAVEEANAEREREKQDQETRTIRQWFAPVDPMVMHTRVYAEHQPGTGSWFLDGPLAWLTDKGDDGAMLWLQGKCEFSTLRRSDRKTG